MKAYQSPELEKVLGDAQGRAMLREALSQAVVVPATGGLNVVGHAPVVTTVTTSTGVNYSVELVPTR